jgi:hypothetical protein
MGNCLAATFSKMTCSAIFSSHTRAVRRLGDSNGVRWFAAVDGARYGIDNQYCYLQEGDILQHIHMHGLPLMDGTRSMGEWQAWEGYSEPESNRTKIPRARFPSTTYSVSCLCHVGSFTKGMKVVLAPFEWCVPWQLSSRRTLNHVPCQWVDLVCEPVDHSTWE